MAAVMEPMKKLFLLVLAITTFFIWLNRNDSPVVSEKPAAAASPTPAGPVKPSAVSEHDWAKHSLDRANEVVGQVHQTRLENEQP